MPGGLDYPRAFFIDNFILNRMIFVIYMGKEISMVPRGDTWVSEPSSKTCGQRAIEAGMSLFVLGLLLFMALCAVGYGFMVRIKNEILPKR